MINVIVCYLTKRLHQLIDVLDFTEKLVCQANVNWIVFGRIHEPPETKRDVVWSLGKICQDRCCAFCAATPRGQVFCEELCEAACVLDQSCICHFFVEQTLEALTFKDLFKCFRPEFSAGNTAYQILEQLWSDVLMKLV